MSSTEHIALFGSDIHFPKQDTRAVNLFLQVAKYLNPDSIDLVGDLDDADSTSRWADGTTEENISIEDAGVKDTRSFLEELRGMFPNAEGHLYDGNHGWTRHSAYIDKKAPAFKEFVTPNSLYGFENTGFEWHYYSDAPTKRFGELYVHHGESISKHAGESVRNDCLNWGVSLLRGHSHRQGVYNKTYDLTGRLVEGYEIGHMMDVKQADYTIAHDWQAGFAYAVVEKDIPHVQLVTIRDYTCFIGTKRFNA